MTYIHTTYSLQKLKPLALILFCLGCLLGITQPAGAVSPYVKEMIWENKLKPTEFKKPEHHPTPWAWSNDEITYTWLGHATVLINVYGSIIITDPVLFSRIGPPEIFDNLLGIKRIMQLPLPIEEIPPIDIALISHAHYDHLDAVSFNAPVLNQNPIILAPVGTRQFFPEAFYVFELNHHNRSSFRTKLHRNLTVNAFRVEHYGFVHFGDRTKVTGVNGYLIRAKSKSIAFFGDTSFQQNRDETGRRLRQPLPVNWFNQVRGNLPTPKKIDLCILPIGDHIYRSNHIGPQQAITIADQVHCQQILPIHYKTFILSAPQHYQVKPEIEFKQRLTKQKRLSLTLCTNRKGQQVFPDIGVECVL